MLAPGVVLEPKRTAGGASAPSPAFRRLEQVGKLVVEVIARSRGRSNKDLAKLADQLKALLDKWDS